jgi:DNA-binding beta-propeller fold protein YncE
LAALVGLLLVAARAAAQAEASPMAHSRAAQSVTGLKPELVLYGGMYSGQFTTVAGVTCDPVSDEIYVADAGADRIEIFDARGAPLFDFTDSEHLTEPTRVAVDRRGRIHVIDMDHAHIKVFSYRGEFIESLTLPGFADGKQSFTAILFDAAGDLYVGESRSGQVLVFAGDDHHLKRRIGTFGDDKGQFDGIVGIAVDEDHVYVASQDGVAIHVFSKAGRLLRAWGYHDAGLQNVSLPSGVAVDAAGRVILVDALRQEIKYFDPKGQLIDIFGGLGALPGDVAYPSDISIDRRGRLCIADRGNGRVQVLAPVEASEEQAAPPAAGAEPGPEAPRPMGLPPALLQQREGAPATPPAPK